ncbi:annexin A7 [Drosophila rhopaloa]|uniref:Annexin A7 n=1 Tax=Drosophila rhopaloa TaxID=1041015 RepID=A0A6P4E835_DRORH|nr:annexin A7 [Drosophila rhopaloa]
MWKWNHVIILFFIWPTSQGLENKTPSIDSKLPKEVPNSETFSSNKAKNNNDGRLKYKTAPIIKYVYYPYPYPMYPQFPPNGNYPPKGSYPPNGNYPPNGKNPNPWNPWGQNGINPYPPPKFPAPSGWKPPGPMAPPNSPSGLPAQPGENLSPLENQNIFNIKTA